MPDKDLHVLANFLVFTIVASLCSENLEVWYALLNWRCFLLRSRGSQEIPRVPAFLRDRVSVNGLLSVPLEQEQKRIAVQPHCGGVCKALQGGFWTANSLSVAHSTNLLGPRSYREPSPILAV